MDWHGLHRHDPWHASRPAAHRRHPHRRGFRAGTAGPGWSSQRILDEYPHLKADDLQAVFAFVRECLKDGTSCCRPRPPRLCPTDERRAPNAMAALLLDENVPRPGRTAGGWPSRRSLAADSGPRRRRSRCLGPLARAGQRVLVTFDGFRRSDHQQGAARRWGLSIFDHPIDPVAAAQMTLQALAGPDRRSVRGLHAVCHRRRALPRSADEGT